MTALIRQTPQEPLPESGDYREAPNNLEAEQALLGAILVNNEALDRVSSFLKPDHFFDPLHGRIFESAAKLIMGGKRATPITLKTFFQSDPEVGDLTVPQYLGRLAALIMGAALLFMSLPALNLVNLNLSRMLERASEIGVRRAFGATAGSLILQLLIENLLIVSAGGVLALGCTQLILDGIARSGLLQNASFHLNLRVFGLALVLVVVFSVLSGILPAWRTARLHPVHALKGNQR